MGSLFSFLPAHAEHPSSDETFSSIRDVFHIMMIIILHVFPKCTNIKCAMFYSGVRMGLKTFLPTFAGGPGEAK